MAGSVHASSCTSQHRCYRASDRYAANRNANNVTGICFGETKHKRAIRRTGCTWKERRASKSSSSAGLPFPTHHEHRAGNTAGSFMDLVHWENRAVGNDALGQQNMAMRLPFLAKGVRHCTSRQTAMGQKGQSYRRNVRWIK